jgi:hypothetical protein
MPVKSVLTYSSVLHIVSVYVNKRKTRRTFSHTVPIEIDMPFIHFKIHNSSIELAPLETCRSFYGRGSGAATLPA